MSFPSSLVKSLSGVLMVGCCLLTGCASTKSLPYSNHEGAALFKLVRTPKIEPKIRESKFGNYLSLKNINELPDGDRVLAYRHESHGKTEPSAVTSVSYYFAFDEAIDRVVNGSSPSACYFINLVCTADGTVLGIEYYSRSPV